MSTIRTNTLLAADGSTTTEPSIPALDQRMAKAWVNFNGTGTVAIRDSYNVSSITDVGTGNYTANFASAMADTNYSTFISGDVLIGVATPVSTTTANMQSLNTSVANVDVAKITFMAMGG